MALVNDFYLGQLRIERMKYGVITLIPQVKEANTIKHYRPICLLNVCFKIFTRMLVGRLTLIGRRIISENQSAFIKGRYIMDSAVILHEVMHEMRRRKEKGIIMKIDFEKAYDRINWYLVEDILKKKDFDLKFISWVMQTVRGEKYTLISMEKMEHFSELLGG